MTATPPECLTSQSFSWSVNGPICEAVMDPSRRPLKKICIVGGGSAGWIAAAALSHQFRGRMAEIELVESDDIGIVGVGESTIPPFLQMLARLCINEQDFLKEVQGSFKLGILFKDWKLKGEDY
ncbi:tryptophan 7-halogenase, partial [Bifidobacterium animalis subsp. lactis]|uniref:tryptophan 7-halogenase n=1 Tax=Bifidobacterium animalis TaxID=28025 RepID=UPI0031976A6D